MSGHCPRRKKRSPSGATTSARMEIIIPGVVPGTEKIPVFRNPGDDFDGMDALQGNTAENALRAVIPGQAIGRTSPDTALSVVVEVVDDVAGQADGIFRIASVHDDIVTVVVVDPVIGPEPDISPVVLADCPHIVVGQALIHRQMRKGDARLGGFQGKQPEEKTEKG